MLIFAPFVCALSGVHARNRFARRFFAEEASDAVLARPAVVFGPFRVGRVAWDETLSRQIFYFSSPRAAVRSCRAGSGTPVLGLRRWTDRRGADTPSCRLRRSLRVHEARWREISAAIGLR